MILTINLKKTKIKIKSNMKPIIALRILVAILFLMSPIEILGEKVPKYTKMNHAKRKLEENDLDNYIKVKYKKDVTYSHDFSIIEYDKSENQYRSDIYLINNNNTSYNPNEALTIKENTEIIIGFNSTLKSLAKFFYDYYDPNVEYISSIDLTHFNSSLIESL